MEGYITFSQLGQLIIFLVVVVAGGYATMTFRNVNAAVKDIGAILKQNQEALNQVIPNIATSSENVVAITNDLRTGLVKRAKLLKPPTRLQRTPWSSARRPKLSQTSLRPLENFSRSCFNGSSFPEMVSSPNGRTEGNSAGQPSPTMLI